MADELDCGPCRLRAFRPEDAPSLARYADNRRIWINASNRFPHPYTLADAEAYIASALAEPMPLRFAIDIGGEAAGAIGLTPGDDVACRSAELGYWLAEPFWGRGITSAAVPAVTAHAFELGFVRVAAIVFSRNRPSIRVLEKAGYVLEGILRCSALKDGVLEDQHLFARLRDGVRPGPL